MILTFHNMRLELLYGVLFKFINKNLIKVYKKNIKRFGFSPTALFWNSKFSQESRFKVLEFLIKKFSNIEGLRIADIGCGFGDLYEYLKTKRKQSFQYRGYDINPEMINYCKNKYNPDLFFISTFPETECDLSIISGTYNYVTINDIYLWEKYLIFNLKECFKRSKIGVIFNLQVSSETKIINNIYYTNLNSMTKLLEKNFTRIHYHFDKRSVNDIYFVVLKN